MLKHYTQGLQTIQEYETTHKTRISDEIKIASVVDSVRGQLRNHMLLSMSDTDDIKNVIADFFLSTYRVFTWIRSITRTAVPRILPGPQKLQK
eukprot:1134162-Amphidinium_carterae.1